MTIENTVSAATEITPAFIAELREKRKAGTQGDWAFHDDQICADLTDISATSTDGGKWQADWIADMDHMNRDDYDGCRSAQAYIDGQLIAAAVNALTSLLDEVESLKAENEQHKSDVKKFTEQANYWCGRFYGWRLPDQREEPTMPPAIAKEILTACQNAGNTARQASTPEEAAAHNPHYDDEVFTEAVLLKFIQMTTILNGSASE